MLLPPSGPIRFFEEHRTEGPAVLQSSILYFLGLLTYLLTHCVFLSDVPGIHYDEAWAATFSAHLTGFPLEAMSPYTVPWSHWVTALFFKIFSVSLFFDRLSGVFLTLIGIVLISLGLFQFKQNRAARLFPWVCAFFLPLILNHRFCIEITTFHVFCFGILFYGLARKPGRLSSVLIGLGLYLGITSHILFIAYALSTWTTRRVQTRFLDRHERVLIISLALALFPFLIRVFLRIPEHDKSIALLILNSIILIDALFPKIVDRIGAKPRRVFLFVASALSIPAFLFLLFFAEGHWNVLFNYGWIAHPELIGLSWIVLILGSVYAVIRFYTLHRQMPWPSHFQTWFILTLLLILLISTKPTSRYYEVGFLGIAIACSIALSTLEGRQTIAILTLFAVSSSTQLWKNYFEIGLKRLGRESYFSFYIPRDNSSDFIPKQDLVALLVKNGCSFSDIQSGDFRMIESLRFLSLGDWPTQVHSPRQGCLLGEHLIVNRKTLFPNPPGQSVRVTEQGPFVIDR